MIETIEAVGHVIKIVRDNTKRGGSESDGLSDSAIVEGLFELPRLLYRRLFATIISMEVDLTSSTITRRVERRKKPAESSVIRSQQIQQLILYRFFRKRLFRRHAELES